MSVVMEYGSSSGGRRNSLAVDSLWLNPNPGNSFGGQTVTLEHGASGYKLIMVEYIFSTGTQDHNTRTFPVKVLQTGAACTLQINAGSSNRTGAREFTLASDNTVTFGAASYNGSTANGYAVPYQIFGIR